MREQPCAACGRLWHSENAHVVKGNKGMGYKADAKYIAPLCGSVGVGCHRLFDLYRADFDKLFPDFDPVVEAAKLENAWQQFINGESE